MVSNSTATVTECDNNTALQVVESTMTDEMKTKFQVAFDTGVELDDSLYKSWKMYKSPRKVHENSSQLKIPLQKKSVNLKKRKQEQYFVISCNEAFNAKQKAYEEKELKKIQLEERKRTRVQQKEEREKLKLEKALKKMKRE